MSTLLIAMCLMAPPETKPVPLDDATRAKLVAIAFQACRDGDVKTLEAYFNVGMPIDALSERKDTLLAVAAYHGQIDAVKVILAQPKIDLEAENRMGLTALSAAAFKGDHKIIELLVAKYAKVNAANDRGQTALMFAALAGKTRAVEVLLQAGADPFLVDVDGNSALSLAKGQGAQKVIDLLAKRPSKSQRLSCP